MRCAYRLTQRSREAAKETVGGQPTEVIETVPQDGGGISLRAAAQRTGKSSAHADAVKAAGKSRDKEEQVVSHGSRFLPDPVSLPSLFLFFLDEARDPYKEADGKNREAEEGDDLGRTYMGEREHGVR
jgi:hypothetical protein